MGVMEIMGKEGDLKVNWDSANREETRAAKEMFDKKTKDGWLAYKVKSEGRGARVTEFDPDLEKLTLIPPVAGG